MNRSILRKGQLEGSPKPKSLASTQEPLPEGRLEAQTRMSQSPDMGERCRRSKALAEVGAGHRHPAWVWWARLTLGARQEDYKCRDKAWEGLG